MEVLAIVGGYVEVRIFDADLIELVRGLRAAAFEELGADHDERVWRHSHIRALANLIEAWAFASDQLDTAPGWKGDRSLAGFRAHHTLPAGMDR